MKRVLVLHGVNLNMFGERDSAHYGTITFNEINERLEQLAQELATSESKPARWVGRDALREFEGKGIA